MKRFTTMKTAAVALCLSLLCASCVVHKHYDGPPHHKKHKTHKKPKPPRHPRHHASVDGSNTGGTYYADAWYRA